VREQLEARGWAVRHALDFADDADAYRAYIASSRGEFTVAKEQNVHFATGWFSDRSATYLAAGRPVVTQDTGLRLRPADRGGALRRVATSTRRPAAIERSRRTTAATAEPPLRSRGITSRRRRCWET
jgi:hypothetical protein